MRLNIMPELNPLHNANLHQTLPQSTSIVNCNIADVVDTASVGGSIADTVKNKVIPKPFKDKLFVKISNLIYNYLLKPRLLEFYCLLSYLVYCYPTTKLPILTIQSLALEHTGIKMSKNTINKYLNNLIELGLISRNNKFYTITNLQNPESYTVIQNNYTQPNKNYTPFFITIYIKNIKQGSVAIELYLASKAYSKHRPTKVCRELNISRKTYYTYLKDIVSTSVVKRIKLDYKNYHYTHDYRLKQWSDSIDIMNGNYKTQGELWEKSKPTKTATNSRKWFTSSMAQVMKDYRINYIKAFDNYNPDDAYAIVKELEKQYKKINKPLTAKIIVKGILLGYNWVKIVDRRHELLKQGIATLNNSFCNKMYLPDYS
jgi:predicted transcriptional regulator